MKRAARADGKTTKAAIVPEETHEPGQAPLPQEQHFSNRQLSLFQTFLANTDQQRDKLSNAIDLWDSVPRYSVSRQFMSKVRIDGRFLEEHRIDFQHRGNSYSCIISPARVTDFDGVKREFYPSANEELIEDALRKLATDARRGYYDSNLHQGGVAFTLYALQQELARRGHTRSYQEIVQSLNILAHCIIELKPHTEGEASIKSACLPMLAAVSRKKLAEDPNSKWAVQFHPLVAAAIDRLEHRQFDYDKLMAHSSQLTRWLHRQLVLKFTQAEMGRPFSMYYSQVRRDSGLLNNYGRTRDAIDALAAAFNELLASSVISKLQREDKRGPRKQLLDVIFTVLPTNEFVYQAKAANKRQLQMTPLEPAQPRGIGRR